MSLLEDASDDVGGQRAVQFGRLAVEQRQRCLSSQRGIRDPSSYLLSLLSEIRRLAARSRSSLRVEFLDPA